MSYDPDTQEGAIRKLREEINKIREEQFSKAFSTNSGGGTGGKLGNSIGSSVPNTGITSFYPNAIRLTKDTGVIKKLHYKLLTLTQEFAIGESVTGATSGATAIIGDIDITSSTAGILFWVPSSVVGTFTANETINGNINGQAKADLSFPITQTGRGHLNAGSASIIVEGVTMPYEIHFIDNAKNNGQLVLLRAQNGQTIRVRRAITNDGNTGNIDLDTSFNIIENAIVILQYQGASNATPDGGWVPVLSSVSSGGSSTGGIDFPILYPKEDLGDKTGVVNLSLNQTDGHYKRIRMIGNISLTFTSPPPASNGFKFYVLLVQDGTGGRLLTSLPSSVKNSADILLQIDPALDTQTLIQFVTADGGSTYHAQVIQSANTGASQWSFFKALTNVNMDTWDLYNIDKLRFFGFGGFSFPVDATMQAISTSPVGLQFNVPLDQKYRFYNAGFEVMSLGFEINNTLRLTDGDIKDVRRVSFHELPGFMAEIKVFPNTLIYTANGVGAVHSFVIDNDEASPNFEMRLNVNKSNRDLNMVTNDIINLDQAQFDPNGGFVSSINHGDRRISGGNSGININVPKLKTVKLWFENTGQTNSDLKYEFKQDGLYMNTNNLFEVQGIFFPNGGSISDLAVLGLEFRAGVTPPFGTGNPQSMIFKVRGPAPSYTDINIFELTGLEHNITNGGGMKMFTDLNLQSQNIHNVDMMRFDSNNGISGGGAYKIAGDFPVGRGFQFNIPPVGFGTNKFSFRSNDVEFMSLTPSELKMVGYPIFPSDSRIVAQQFNFNAPHSQGTLGMFDGFIRLVVNGGVSDVWVATGGVLKNLSTLGSTSFINPLFTADGDLNMGTFNIFNLDVLRFVVDGGVIGFGTYGIAVDAGNNSLRYSTPANKAHLFQINLDDVVSIGSSGIQAIPNATFANPNIIAREFLLSTHSIGTGSMINGSFRKLGNDVFVRTGNTTVNLTTLSAGGADDLGSHIATQALDMNSQEIINFNVLRSTTNKAIDSVSAGWNYETAFSTEHQFLVRNAGNTAFINVGKFNSFGFDAQGLNVQQVNAISFDNAGVAISQTATNMTFGIPSGNFIFSIGVAEYTMSSTALGMIGNNINDVGHIRFNEIADPTALANSAFLYGKDDAGVTKLFMRWSNGTITELGAGGAGGVQLGDSPTWTGLHTFNNVAIFNSNATFNGANVFINSPIINLGNSSADTILTAGRFGSDVITSNLSDLGTLAQPWANVFFQNLRLQFGATVNNISTLSTTNNNTSLMTSQAIQTLVASVGGVSLSGNNNWTGTNTFNGTTNLAQTNIFNLQVNDLAPVFQSGSISTFAISGTAVNLTGTQTITGGKTFNGLVDVNGSFSANGSINFSGSGRPSSGGFVSSGATLQQFKNAHNTMRASLVSLGLLSP